MRTTNRSKIEEIMNRTPALREKLFSRGFLFTSAEVNENAYPFYGLWKNIVIERYRLIIDPKQHFFIRKKDNFTFLFIGHAYNPFTMCSDEVQILDDLLNLEFAKEDFWNSFNQLTGIFTMIVLSENHMYVVGDPTCMQTTFYVNVGKNIYVSSHTNLLGDLLNLKWDPYVKKLSEYTFFHLLGNTLPGDITQFQNIKRLVPNYYLEIDNLVIKRCVRFYWPHFLKISDDEIVRKTADILHKNMSLIADKWKKPAISLTGGCDSKTTLACTKGLYDKFSYFSYISSESEKVDADAAHQICKTLQLKHHVYRIPEKDSAFENIESIRAILEWNTGAILRNNKNDVRKRAYFADTTDFDVEVKSWVSEVGRAYYSKRFNGRKKFGLKPTARKCTTMYKFFLNNRKLVKQTDKVFKEYLEKYFDQDDKNPIEWQEQFFWEFRVSSWNSLVITGEHKYSFDITIPYNNRKLLKLLLCAPINERINDTIYTRIRKMMNSAVDDTGISVTNLKHTKNREKVENLYYIIHSRSPF